MALDALKDPDSAKGCFKRVGDQLGVNAETLRVWVRQAQVDSGTRPGVSTEDHKRIKELEAENKELRRANAILKSASAFFAAELDRPLR
jgi:transposase